MVFGSESNPSLYCKLDIEVYPIVRATNKDPRKTSAIVTGFAVEWMPTRDVRIGRAFQGVELQDRSGELAQGLRCGTEYRKFIFLKVRKCRYVCTQRQISNNRDAIESTDSAVARSLPSEMPGTRSISLDLFRDTRPRGHSQQGGQMLVARSGLGRPRRSLMQGEQL